MRQPAGVVLGMAPWNAPVILGVRAIAVPLACGNTVVLKGSELCPATHGLIVEALQEAGFPNGVVNFVTNAPSRRGCGGRGDDRAPGSAPRELHRLDATSARSSPASAPSISSPSCSNLAARRPLLVLDDADLDAAVNGAAFGAFANSGQICMSTERIIVDRDDRR